jgi:hypothetical protein
MSRTLLRELNGYQSLAGRVITAGAGHTVRAHARLICGELLAHYVFTVKQNTPALWDELDALDWVKVPSALPGTCWGCAPMTRQPPQ